MNHRLPLLLVPALALLACAVRPDPERPAHVAAPLTGVRNAFDSAASPQLPRRDALEWDDLHNVQHLSESIVSGSEPHGDAAFARLAAWGVKTVMSVDGKAPDLEAAERHGLRYVHVPIQYSGITPTELERMAKAFRELEAPFYVHCFHGKHRGPAAAAVGRLVVDGAERDLALAEMRQWCGTAGKYAGLYASIASDEIPDARTTEALEVELESVHTVDGFRSAMVGVSRAFDHLEAAADRGWAPDAEHPDVVPVEEAKLLLQHFQDSRALPEVSGQAANFVGWVDDSTLAAAELIDALEEGRTERAEELLERIDASCTACHAAHRNR